MLKLVIMRGVPGSGKSYTAKKLLEENPKGVICSTDSHFIVNGTYEFKPEFLGRYHQRNFAAAKYGMEKKVPLVIIDNTNIKRRDFSCYVKVGNTNGYEIEYKEPDSPWWITNRPGGTNPFTMFGAKEAALIFAEHCTHNVPVETIARMLIQWQEVI